MSYNVLLERQAEKELRALSPQMLRRIDKRLVNLAAEPWPRGSAKLKGKETEDGALKPAITVFFIPLIKRKK